MTNNRLNDILALRSMTEVSFFPGHPDFGQGAMAWILFGGNMEEIWKDIDGFNGRYRISNFGRVMSFSHSPKGKIKKPSCVHGYPYISLLNSNGKRKSCYVHRLVGTHFIGELPRELETNHIDGNKYNNHVSNLEYVTGSQNMKHAFRLGLVKPIPLTRGSEKGNAKLNEQKVKEIMNLLSLGNSQSVIAKKFNVHQSTISLIKTRKKWTHVKGVI